ncbi:MAG: non-canonical purine NTP diphosphatase [Crocinitomicaceae bacterium]
MNIVFATQNKHKAEEIQALLPDSIQVKTLIEIDCHEDIPETADTLEGNALLKSEYVLENFKMDCFADDTGLEIEALSGEPGVKSARYAGEAKDANQNMDLVLKKLQGIDNRSAQFRTVISLRLNGESHMFEGSVKGVIREEKSGTAGFGYDPIFEPEGYNITFSEMSLEEKNKISHRGKAVRKLIDFLNNL